jgi:hypothetical protein
MRHIARNEDAGPLTVNSSSILKVNFAAPYVGRLVVVAVKVGCRFRAGRRGFLEQHDAVASVAARHAQYRAAIREAVPLR